MANIVIRPVRPGDVEQLVVKMRQADVAELDALGLSDHIGCLRQSVADSAFCYTAVQGDEVVCVFGVVPADGVFGDYGIPWMLGTDLVTTNQRVLMRLCRPYIDEMLRAYPNLFNVVHAENSRAVRWLKCVGFSLHPAEPHGPLGALFHRFEMKA